MPRSQGWTLNNARGSANLNIKYHHPIISGLFVAEGTANVENHMSDAEQCDPEASVTGRERLPLDNMLPASIEIPKVCGGHVKNKRNSPVVEYS